MRRTLTLVFAALTLPGWLAAAEPVCPSAGGPCRTLDPVDVHDHRGIGVAFTVPHPVDRVRNVLADCERWPTIFNFIQSCKVLGDGSYEIMLDVLGMHPHRIVGRLEAGRSPDVMWLHRQAGDFRDLHAEWWAKPTTTGETEVQYAMAIDAGALVPDWLTRRYTWPLLGDIVEGLSRWAPQEAKP